MRQKYFFNIGELSAYAIHIGGDLLFTSIYSRIDHIAVPGFDDINKYISPDFFSYVEVNSDLMDLLVCHFPLLSPSGYASVHLHMMYFFTCPH